MKVYGYGTPDADSELKVMSFERKDPRAGEIAFRVTHCGVCHSDVHQAHNDWENTVFPCIPGHEVVGVVTAVGAGVRNFKEGDRIGVGCMVNSCQSCTPCENHEEQYCNGPKGATLTYNGPVKPDGTNTYGGYSTDMVVREEFALQIPEALTAGEAGPIMCAGITVYAPMQHWKLGKGQRLGVAGIGGLGHMAVQIGKALGAEVVALTQSPDQAEEYKSLGADQVIDMNDEEQVENAAQSLDLMINTIPYAFDPAPYVSLMKHDTTMVVVGNMIAFEKFSPADMVFNRVSIAGSLIGGVEQTQEILDLCAEHGIRPQIKTIGIDEVNAVFKKLTENKSDIFRHVIDMDTLRNHAEVQEAGSVEDPVRGEVVSG